MPMFIFVGIPGNETYVAKMWRNQTMYVKTPSDENLKKTLKT